MIHVRIGDNRAWKRARTYAVEARQQVRPESLVPRGHWRHVGLDGGPVLWTKKVGQLLAIDVDGPTLYLELEAR